MSFTTEIGSFSKGTQKRVQQIRRGATIKLFSAVILDTPVLSGRLRGNWRLSEESPDSSTRELLDPSGIVVLGEVKEGVDKSKGDTSLFLSNNLPYAAAIEFDGHSHTKAPDGMVRKNIGRFNQLIKLENDKGAK